MSRVAIVVTIFLAARAPAGAQSGDFGTLLAGDAQFPDHVVNMSVTVSYSVRSPAFLALKVSVPYIASTTVSAQGYPFCPTSYLIDFLPPIDAAKYSSLSSQDRLGAPKTSCSAYDYVFDPGAFDFPDLGGTLTYPEPPERFDCGRPSYAWYCNTPVSWKRTIDEVGQIVTYHSNVSTSHVANFERACRSLEDNAKVVTVTKRFVELALPDLPEPFIAEVETYEWDLYVCAVGPHGPGCHPAQYGYSCKRFPARFESAAQHISSVVATEVGCAHNNATVSFESAKPMRDAECPAGWERLRVSFVFEGFVPPGETPIVTLAKPLGFAGSAVVFEAPRLVVTTPCANTGLREEGRFNPEAFVEMARARDGAVGFQFSMTVDEGADLPCNYTAALAVEAAALIFATEFPVEVVEAGAGFVLPTGIGAGIAAGLVAIGGLATATFRPVATTAAACKTCATTVSVDSKAPAPSPARKMA